MLSAITTATASPTQLTLPDASAGCDAIFIGVPSLEWIIQPQIRLPILSIANCSPVRTSTTPGIFFAAEVSMLLILACACGERTNTARASPGRTTSSVYWPWRVMNRKSSLRRTAAPMPVPLFSVIGGILPFSFLSSCWRLARHRLRTCFDCLDDVVIARAAADIAVELFADGMFVETVAVATNDIERRHDHAGRAVAALQAMMFAEGFLHRMQLAARFRQTLDGGDLGAFALQR